MNHNKKFFSIFALSLLFGLMAAFADANSKKIDAADEIIVEDFSMDEFVQSDEMSVIEEVIEETSEAPAEESSAEPSAAVSEEPVIEPSIETTIEPGTEPSVSPEIEASNDVYAAITEIVREDESGAYNSLGWNLKGESGQPYFVTVNRGASVVTVYAKDISGNYTKPVKAMLCSTGVNGHLTPQGTYTTKERYRWRQLYQGVGQYAIRIEQDVLFHSVPYYTMNQADLEYEEFNKLGEPASMACVRMAVADVKWLYDNLPDGFKTVIYDDAENPGPLGKPENIIIDINDTEKRGWDPTDPDENNPWNKSADALDNSVGTALNAE